MTPLQAHREFERISGERYAFLKAIHNYSCDEGWPEAFRLPRRHTLELTPDEIAEAGRFVDLARFLQILMNFEGFYRGVFTAANGPLELDLKRDHIEYLSVSGPENNFATEFKKHLGIEVDGAPIDASNGRSRCINVPRLLEYWGIRHQWMHRAGELSGTFLENKAPTLASEGWWDGLDRCWVLRERGDVAFTSPLEQVLGDVNGLVRWLAPEIERRHRKKLEGLIAG
jgi:hypothetical protein